KAASEVASSRFTHRWRGNAIEDIMSFLVNANFLFARDALISILGVQSPCQRSDYVAQVPTQKRLIVFGCSAGRSLSRTHVVTTARPGIRMTALRVPYPVRLHYLVQLMQSTMRIG
ncbi:MAG: hypothetical protein QGH33_01065, partial [Pirellulaceae bacterium]|nr:hypothetical protein [Pirellulaceae bacterium]